MRLTLLALVLTGILGGCRRGGEDEQIAPASLGSVFVTNDNQLDAHVYLVVGARTVRLGDVNGYQRRRITLPRWLQSGSELRFGVDLIGSREVYYSPSFAYWAGGSFRLTIGSPLHASQTAAVP